MAEEKQSVFNAYDQRFRGSVIGNAHPETWVLGWRPNRPTDVLVQPHEKGTFFTQARAERPAPAATSCGCQCGK